MTQTPEDQDFPALSAEELKNESWHDVILRTRRAELIAGRANANAIAAVAELQNSAAKTMTREEYQRKVDEWVLLRRRERQHARILIAVVALFSAAVLGLGFYGLQSSDQARVELAARQDTIERVFYDSCIARNAQLTEQERVYQRFIEIEKDDVGQEASIRDEKISTYVDALAALPSPIDCSALRFGAPGR